MKKIIYFLILALGIFGCSSEENTPTEGNFAFTKDYTTQVTVGGFVGIRDTTFKAGESYKGIDTGKEKITIRIAEHTQLNDNCPNSSCYQELLEVPRAYLKYVK